MKKTLIFLSILSLCLTLTTKAIAQEGIYGAVEVEKTTKLEAPPEALPGDIPELKEETALPSIGDSKTHKEVYADSDLDNKQNVKLQDALLKIDSAQVDIKNELNLYESKLLDVKNRETLVKQERKELFKQVKAIKKKMKSLDSAKKKIISNMEVDKVSGEGAPVPKKGFNFFK